MSKFLLAVCVFGLLLSSAAARDAETVPSDRFPNFKKENVRTMTVPTGEMLPTVPAGSFIFVNTRFPTIQLGLGDIVTFYLLKDTSIIYIKRIVGMGGDRIQMINGALYINEQAVKREQVADYIPDEKVDPRGISVASHRANLCQWLLLE
jgi:signal peptidase I